VTVIGAIVGEATVGMGAFARTGITAAAAAVVDLDAVIVDVENAFDDDGKPGDRASPLVADVEDVCPGVFPGDSTSEGVLELSGTVEGPEDSFGTVLAVLRLLLEAPSSSIPAEA
jgi:hypothetical protein